MDGEHKVTLAIHSGVPNPFWSIKPSHKRYNDIKRHLDTKRTKMPRHHMPAILGYKGFLVQLPGVEEAELIVGEKTRELQEYLLETMPEEVMSKDLRETILEAIKEMTVPHPSNVPLKEVSHDKAQKIPPYAPKLDLDRWNTDANIQENNNCYNYANDHITGSFAQPGRASGHLFPALTPAEVLKASKKDGLEKVNVGPDGTVPEVLGKHEGLVALFVSEEPRKDFHWYRLDDNGLWSQKPGSGPATNKDGKGELIKDPRDAANLSPLYNYKFVSFMKVFKDKIE